MNIIITNTSERPIYEQIYDQIKQMILSDVLSEGSALPSMRLLAKELRISVITTKRAYEELERDGFIVSITGKGSFVSIKNIELVKEEIMKKIDQGVQDVVQHSKYANVSLEELQALVKMCYEEE